jgi:hypothetical protein
LTCAFLSVFLPEAAAGAGLFEDFGESSSFILSPRVQSLSVAAARTEDEGRDAFLYSLYASYPIQSALLLQVEQSYITISAPSGIKGGFGDFRIRLRARLNSVAGRALYFTSALRSGSGSRRVFPYASGSIDASVGFAFVDSLTLFSYWGEAGGTTVWRGPEAIDENSAHDNYAVISAGISFPLRGSFDVRFFGAGYFLASGSSREIFGVLTSYRASSFVSLFASVQAEAGKKEERVTDVAAVAGARIYY